MAKRYASLCIEFGGGLRFNSGFPSSKMAYRLDVFMLRDGYVCNAEMMVLSADFVE